MIYVGHRKAMPDIQDQSSHKRTTHPLSRHSVLSPAAPQNPLFSAKKNKFIQQLIHSVVLCQEGKQLTTVAAASLGMLSCTPLPKTLWCFLGCIHSREPHFTVFTLLPKESKQIEIQQHASSLRNMADHHNHCWYNRRSANSHALAVQLCTTDTVFTFQSWSNYKAGLNNTK